MNCRRVNSLLSAYLDAELTGAEMLEIRRHLGDCPPCSREYETLRETKEMVASLALKTPRAELEALLLTHAKRSASASPLIVTASRIATWLGMDAASITRSSLLRPRPLAATAVLSLAGLWLASASLDAPGADGSALGSADAMAYVPVYATGSGAATAIVIPPAPALPAITPTGSSVSASPGTSYPGTSYRSGYGPLGAGANLTPVALSLGGIVPTSMLGGGAAYASGFGTGNLFSIGRRLAPR